MLNKLAFIFCLLVSFESQAQWVSKNVQNGIDEPYKIAYCLSQDNTAALKLEKVDTQVTFYLTGGYHCDENTTVDIGLTVGGEIKRHSFFVWTSTDRKTVVILEDITSSDYSDFLRDFKEASKLSIRINESHCDDDYYSFNMSGSTKALDFISK